MSPCTMKSINQRFELPARYASIEYVELDL